MEADIADGLDKGRLTKIGKHRPEPVRARPLAESVLRLIWQERQISRAEIARRFGLSRSTVTEIMKELLQTGLVAEVGTGESVGGRRPIILEFQDEAATVLGVDIGATHIAVALTSLRGRLLAWEEVRYPVRNDPEGTISQAIKLSDACLAKRGRRLVRIGVAVPSPVDPLHPEWLPEVVIPAWRGRNELARLHEYYDVPMHIDNDANLGALAEYWRGAGPTVDDLIYIKMGLGIGAGYILGGKIYRGAGGFAGEIGHLSIDPKGRPCVCGLKGCLVTLVGAEALLARAKTLLSNHPKSVLAGKAITIDAIENAVLFGDKLALQIVREAAEHLGIAIASWCNLMNPGMVVLGGGLAGVGERLLKPLREKVERSTLVSSAAAQIRTSELGTKAVAMGAATLATEAAFDEPSFFR